MKIYFFHFLFFCSILLLETVVIRSFEMNSLFLLDIAMIVSLIHIMARGFNEGILWVLSLGFFYDMILSEVFGVAMISFLVASYGLSFFSHRFLTGRGIVGRILISFYVIGATLWHHHVLYFSQTQSFSFSEYSAWLGSFDWRSSLFTFVIILMLFWGLSFINKQREKVYYISSKGVMQ